MPRQHCQLSHRKWSHRLLCIWNAPRGGKSAIAPQRFESIVKPVGGILLVRELLISCYMTGLARSKFNILRSRSHSGNEGMVPNDTAFCSQSTVRVMFAAPISCRRTQGCSILHTMTRSLVSGMSAFHLAACVTILLLGS